MRLRRLAVIVILGGVSLIAIACGLEQGGMLVEPDAGIDGAIPPDSGGNDVVIDVPIPDIFVPPPCTTLDASCLPNYPGDAGWKPVARTSASCPTTGDSGWTTATYQIDASVVPGTCAPCSCSLNVPSCAPEGGLGLYPSNNSTCSGNPASTITLQPDACVEQGGSNGYAVGYYPPNTPTTCDAGGGGDAQVATKQVNVCATSACDVDFCGLKNQGYAICILNENGDVPCPGGYQKQVAGKTAGAQCGACGCQVTQQSRCSGSIRTYQSSGCSSFQDFIPTDGGCSDLSNFASVRLSVSQTDAACSTLSAPNVADLVGKVTICCVP